MNNLNEHSTLVFDLSDYICFSFSVEQSKIVEADYFICNLDMKSGYLEKCCSTLTICTTKCAILQVVEFQDKKPEIKGNKNWKTKS